MRRRKNAAMETMCSSALATITTISLLHMLVIISVGYCAEHDGNAIPRILENEKPAALGPNFTSCHTSLTKSGNRINCCPVKPAAPAVDFVLPDISSAPLRVRRAAHRITDKNYIAKYQAAISLMKQLPADHPHNFRRQADVHCSYCTNAFDQANHGGLGFQVHDSWLFFPWHRAYLYFHERILGKLIGDDSFALPFWNWDHPAGMMMPRLYLQNGSTLNDSERDPAHLPPRVVDDGYSPDDNDLPPDELVAKNLALMYNQMVSGAKEPELFMGCKLRPGPEGFCSAAGTIESAPHNPVHLWTGNPKNPAGEDMGALYSAARDPIFFAHHGNVDRLWAVWKDVIRNNTLEFADRDWLDAYSYFYDENAQLVRVRVRDMLDPSKLGYTYEHVDLPWLHAKPEPLAPGAASGDHKAARRFGPTSDSAVGEVDFGAAGRPLNAIVTVEVPRDMKKAAAAGEEVLVVHGIDAGDKDVYVKFDVYVNAVNMTAAMRAGPRCREFAGTFARIPSGAGRMKMKSALKLGMSDIVRGLKLKKASSLSVTLVPLGGKDMNTTTVEGIKIEYMRA